MDPNPEETRRAWQAVVSMSLPTSRTSAIMIAFCVVIVAAAFVLPNLHSAAVIVGIGAVMIHAHAPLLT
jgi:hypothetical protein